MKPSTNSGYRWAVTIGMTIGLLLSACGGGDEPTHMVTLTKSVEVLTCTEPKIENTTFAADIEALHQSTIQPAKIYCKGLPHITSVAACSVMRYWFDIFIDVPPSQVSQAEGLGYTKFVPPGERVPPEDIEYVDFQCRPGASQL